MKSLQRIVLNWQHPTLSTEVPIQLSYQLFGQPLHSSPIVLVNHALTGNSNVAGEKGWWNSIIGYDKVIDLHKYTVIAFNIPGNGFDLVEITNYKDYTSKHIASIFLEGLHKLNINQLHAIIGGSLGGGIAWEMVLQQPSITSHLIPIASDWKSTDWLIANCKIQEQLLENSNNPVHDARMHAMLCYRTPDSFNQRFGRSINEELQMFNVESWLYHHGNKLQQRFQLSAYKLMNQLLKTIHAFSDFSDKRLLQIEAAIHIVGVSTDLFFTPSENRNTFSNFKQLGKEVYYDEINSIHGHDAFLIEYEQLTTILQPIFTTQFSNSVAI